MKMKQITLEEAQLLYDLGSYPCYKNPRTKQAGWTQMHSYFSRPGLAGDKCLWWGVPEEDNEEKLL